MNELLYFRDIDVLADVEYETQNSINMLSYTTSREITIAERMAIEKNILFGYAPKSTSYFADTPSSFSYLGFDRRTELKFQDWKRDLAAAGKENKIIDTDAALLEDYWMSHSLVNWKAEISSRKN